MLYQNTFQNKEEPAQTRVSCFGYHTTAEGHFPLHCHAYYELSYVVSGSRYYIIDGKRYEACEGMLFLISPLQVHGYQNCTECNDLVIQFSSDFLRDTSSAFDKNKMLMLSNEKEVFLRLESEEAARQILERLYRLRHYDRVNTIMNNVSKDWEMVGLLLGLLSELLSDNRLSICDGPIQRTELVQLTKVINHILSNPSKKLDMQEAAHITGISYYNFSRFFKQATGLGYSEYCNLLRIRYTEDLLINTNQSVTEIAEAVGIKAISYFTRLFKSMNGLSPTQYRDKYGKK